MTKADVYWHTRKRMWSVRVDGRVVDHMVSVALADCRMVVREAERQRYIRTRQRNVSAWITGTLVSPPPPGTLGYEFVLINYSPYWCGAFTIRPSYQPIHRADLVVLTEGRQAWALVESDWQPENSA
ncbi:hypothetical protein ILT44_04435 [Microvirga sp. BT689]|uniref:hypothetical protein n=1 Tax=Microvirga arvi TaxID=2778731 RepID=UPI001951FC01|nr:hypothetical protein [Microvirga arvi]MBM6579422.1 hypothetical protein [Microvirga arvi]